MADRIYWSNDGDNTIRGAPLAGGGTADPLYDGPTQGVSYPAGVAINPAAGRIYWADDDAIRGAPLAGGGTPATLHSSPPPASAFGVATDPAAGRIYWATGFYGDPGWVSTILGGPLAGGGTVTPLYSFSQYDVVVLQGVAIDPAAGRIYWADAGNNTIRGAPLAGGGTADPPLYGSAQGVSGPRGVAIDPAAGRIYWANGGDNTIRGAPLAGGGAAGPPLYGPAQGVSNPVGVAIDPTAAAGGLATIDTGSKSWLSTAWERIESLVNWRRGSQVGRIYWSNDGDNTIRGAPLAGGGTADPPLYGSAQGVSDPRFLAVLRAPLGTGAPTISWSLILPNGRFDWGPPGPPGQRLHCSRGAWAADLLGSFLYRAPQSFAYQWRLGGTDIGGATAPEYKPSQPGSYTCRVTATNGAGSDVQTSAAVTVS